MGDPRHDLGHAAEAAVAAWLEASGWQILARRHRSPAGGEVDLIARDPDGVLVGIEVRARRTTRAGLGSETLDARRTARIGRTLAAFAAGSRAAHRGLRVDLVRVTPMPGPHARWRLRRIPGIGAW
jgi:putative endonuclease